MANSVVTVKIDADTGEAVKEIDNVKESVKGVSSETANASDSFSAFGDVADSVTGGLAGKLRGAKGAVGGLSTGFKGLRVAIISTGIGALVVLLGSLYAYLSSTEEGAKKLKIATEFLGVVLKKYLEFVGAYFEGVKMLFTEPQKAIDKLKLALEPVLEFFKDINIIVVGQVMKGFKQLSSVLSFLASKYYELIGNQAEANLAMAESIQYSKEVEAINQAQAESWDDIKEAVSDAGDSIVGVFKDIISETTDALNIATKYANAQIATRNLIQRLTVDNAKLNRTIEEQQKVIDDTTKSYDERKEALLIQSEASAQLAQNIAKQARAEESLLHQQIAITANYEEREELESALADKIAQRIDAEKQINIVNLDNAQKSREIDREELDRKRTILQQLNDLRLESLNDEKLVEEERLALAEKTGLEELELLRATEEEKQSLRDYYAQIRANKETELNNIAKEQSEKDKNDELQRIKELNESRVRLAGDAMGALGSLSEAFAGDSEQNAKKQFEISKALNLATAITNTGLAVTAALTAGGNPVKLATGQQFVEAGIAAAAGIAQIAKIKSAKFGGVVGSTGGGPTPSLGGSGNAGTVPQLNTDALQTDNQTSIRAYVVSKDVTTASAQTQQIEQQANLVL